MEIAKKPHNESMRVAMLKKLRILDTPAEQSYDNITQLLAKIFDVPTCLISLVDSERQWFKSRHGMQCSETSRDIAFCSHAILQDDVFIIEDARLDERFNSNPLVTTVPEVISYIGIPLNVGNGLRLGTLCLIDTKPRTYSNKDIEILKSFARQIETLFELRLKNIEVNEMANYRARFLAEMSHEIRTPVSGIMSISYILKEKAAQSENSDIKEYSEILIDCSNDLLTVVNDILDYSKLENRKMNLERKEFNLVDLINQSVRQFLPKFKSKNIDVSIDIAPSVPLSVISDPTRIKQVLINLISNALKFTDSGKVSITSKLKDQSADSLTLEFAVTDTGIGIAKEKLAALFNPYNQADESIARVYGGTGLGLSICKGLVDLLEGNIWCESKPKKGSTFAFTIKVPR